MWYLQRLRLIQKEHNKPVMLFEPTVLWTLSFCIALCSVEFLLHSVVLGDFGLGLVLEKDEVCDKFWCNRKWRLLYTLQILQRKYQKPCFDCRKSLSLRQRNTKSKEQRWKFLLASQLQLACILALATEREVCRHLLQSSLTKIHN